MSGELIVGLLGLFVSVAAVGISVRIAKKQQHDSKTLTDLHTKVLTMQSAVALRSSLRRSNRIFLDVTNVGLQQITDVEVTALLAENRYDVTVRTNELSSPWRVAKLGPQQTLSVVVQTGAPTLAIVKFKDSEGASREVELPAAHL